MVPHSRTGVVPGLGMPETVPPLCIGPNKPSPKRPAVLSQAAIQVGLGLIWPPVSQRDPNASACLHRGKLSMPWARSDPVAATSLGFTSRAHTGREMVFKYTPVGIKPWCRSCMIISSWLAAGVWKRASKFVSFLVPEVTDPLAKKQGEP